MATTRKILIADPNLEEVRSLTRLLRERGFQVYYAPDGSKALELSVLRHPDVTLFDDACPLIDARTFVSILRSNPRTAEIPVVLTTASSEGDPHRGLRDGWLQKPFNLDEVLARIEHILRRSDAARDLKGESREIEGTLGQLGVADVLQILAMNRRTGRLELRRELGAGEIFVGEGRPLNARVGSTEGEKALFRLLTWEEGAFAFVPGPPSNKVRIARMMEDALLEGMRQKDELKRLEEWLPSRGVRLQLASEVELSQSQHPVTAQVLELLHQPRTVGELLDHSPATDLDTAQAVLTLLEKGYVRQVEATALASEPLLGSAELHALRSKLFRSLNAKVAVAKVMVVGNAAVVFDRLRRELPEFAPLSLDGGAAKGGFGTLGLLELSDSLRLEVSVLPLGDAARPLWRPFSTGAMGAWVFETGATVLAQAEFLAHEMRLPMVVMADRLPRSLEGSHASATGVGVDSVSALRTLLMQALHLETLVPSIGGGGAGGDWESGL